MTCSNCKTIPGLDDILKSRALLEGIVRKSPLHRSRTFSDLTGTNLFLKLESLQVTGSFKVRGAYAKVCSLSHDKAKRGVVAASAGNHAQGVAFAAARRKIRCTIVMPLAASAAKMAATRSHGAKVIRCGAGYDDAWQAAQEIAYSEGMSIIHAFDDSEVIAGQGTVGLEILEDLPDVNVIYVPIGGGGLAAGVAIAIKSTRPNVKIIGVESSAFPAMKNSVESASLAEAQDGLSIADGIAVRRPGELTYGIVRRFLDEIVLIDDESIMKTMLLLMERAKLVVEPAGAASLAYVLSNNGFVGKHDKAVAIISGGNVDLSMLGQILVSAGQPLGKRATIPSSIALAD
ncbi:MAG: threonine ammonia-lyase [Ignavibacteriales bacterium]|nr:threonine ammonia-lyase [Ignavibacteriales bacterium]